MNKLKENLTRAVYYISTKNYGLYNNLKYSRTEEIFRFSGRYENSNKNIRIIPITHYNYLSIYFLKIKN